MVCLLIGRVRKWLNLWLLSLRRIQVQYYPKKDLVRLEKFQFLHFAYQDYCLEDSLILWSILEKGGNRGHFSPIFRSNEFDHCSGDKTYDGETSNSQFVSQCGRNDLNHVSATINLCQDSSGTARANWVEDLCPIEHTNVTDVNSDLFLKDAMFPSSANTFKAPCSSSFEFYVRNEEGINLCVDLSSSTSDWIQKLESEVNIRENICQNKSSGFQQELRHFRESNIQLKNSFLQNLDAQKVKDGNVPSETSPSTFMTENKNSVLNDHDGGGGSLTSIAVKPSSNFGFMSENLREDKGFVSSDPNSDAHDGTCSCTDENGCSTNVDSNVNFPGTKLPGNSCVSMLDCPESVPRLEHQNSKPSSEICEYSTVENRSSLTNYHALSAGCSTGGSMEMPLLKVDNTETEQSGLANSSEHDIDISRNQLPTSVEDCV